MKLINIAFSEYDKLPKKWELEDFKFNPKINLIVGKNATGKSRIINIVNSLANVVSGRNKKLFTSANWKVFFDNKTQIVNYELQIEDFKVKKETLIVNEEVLLKRDEEGSGQIKAVEINDNIKFKIPNNELAVVKKRDEIQHPFLEDLYNWADLLRVYRFGTELGRNNIGIFVSSKPASEAEEDMSTPQPDLKNPENVVLIFKTGIKEFGDNYIKKIKSDMKFIGYTLDSITVEPARDIHLVSKALFTPKEQPECIYVKEKNIKEKISQLNLSQGMFRALSLVIQLNYLELTKQSLSNCVLIDDIGEGLDFERASSLIKLLLSKIEHDNLADLQLIMTSNDRFTMNVVPIKYWSILERKNSKFKIYNIHNSGEILKKFELAGLNNFDLFATDFYKGKKEKK